MFAAASWRNRGAHLGHGANRQPALVGSFQQHNSCSSFCCFHRRQHQRLQPTNGHCCHSSRRFSSCSYHPAAGDQRGIYKTLTACHIVAFCLCFAVDGLTHSQATVDPSVSAGTVQSIAPTAAQDAPQPSALPTVDSSTPAPVLSSSSMAHLAIMPLFLCVALLV
jgi:hypothetical protein